MLSLLVPQVHAKHAAVVLTALLVREVVSILQLLVLLEPFPLVQQRVVHVPVVLIALRVRPVVFLFVLLEPIPVVRRACHAALASTVPWVPHRAITLQLLVLLEPFPLGQQRVIHVPAVLTALPTPPIVTTLQLLVLLAPMPVVQQRVKHVPPVRAV